MDFSIPATAFPVKEIILGVYKGADGVLKRRLKNYIADKKIKKIYDHLRDIGKVRTIWQTERPVPIKNFYYPQKVSCDEFDFIVNSFDDLLRISKRVVVQGIVGQGKSIFLRYLCTNELKSMNTIPVFIELRRYDKKFSLSDHICKFLDEVGFDGSVDTFNFLMEKNKIRLILDAYDELPDDVEAIALKEIESIARKYPDLDIVVSSRPDYSIQRSELFSVVNIAPLEESDLIKILHKLCSSKEIASEIYEGICASTSSIASILTTPLMVTLLVFVYKSDHKIPVRPIEFYDSLFSTVLNRHDKLKPGGVDRSRKALIADSEFQKIFNCLSFLSGQDSKISMKESEVVGYLERAKKYTKISYSPEDFISDVCKITCLILKDGFDYNFLHKSIQEYHSAKFLSSIPEDKAISFYGKILSDGKWKKWLGQVDFLLELDAYRCNKYFIIPSCEIFESMVFDKSKNLKSVFINQVLKNTKVRVRAIYGKVRITNINMVGAISGDIRNNYLHKKFLSSIVSTLSKVNGIMKKKSAESLSLKAGGHRDVELIVLLKELAFDRDFSNHLNANLKQVIDATRNHSNSIISRLDSAEELFDF